MNTLMQDIRYGVRALRTNPLFTIVAALTLALGIGANTAIFSIVNAYLFKPMAVKNPEEIVQIGVIDPSLSIPHEMTYPTFEDIRDRSGVLADGFAYQNNVVNMGIDGQNERAYAELVSGNCFSMLGVEAIHGRMFTAEECAKPGTAPVVVISYNFWKNRFGGQTSVVGKNITLCNQPFTIIGVAPESFTGVEPLIDVSMYVPMMMKPLLYPVSKVTFVDRSYGGYRMMGRLKAGTDINQARAALQVLAAQLNQEYPANYKDMNLVVYPELRARPHMAFADAMPMISLSFMALVGLVLLIACANVANLILSRATTRAREMAIRAAMGATRFHLVRLLIVESLLLGLISGLAGVLLALWGIDLLGAIRFSVDAPINFHIEADWRVFIFSLLIALMTGIIAGLLPAFQSSRVNLNESLKEGGRTGSAGGKRQRLRSAFVVAQVAASFLLLICAGLFIRSLEESRNINLGFRTDNLLMFSVDLELEGYDKERGGVIQKQLLDRLRQLPQVRGASLASHTPIGYNNESVDVYTTEQTARGEQDFTTIYMGKVGSDYFQTMEIPIVDGRAINERDDEKSPQVAVINEAMAHTLWQGQNPLGRQFRTSRDGQPIEVVGIARDSKYIFLGEDPRPFIYLPMKQSYRSEVTYFLHTDGNPTALVNATRQAVRDLDSKIAIYDVKSMEEHLSSGLAFMFVRLGATLAGIFGIVGLVLAVVGIYGVISYSVSQRTHEMGIRLALGAQTGDILKIILKQGMGLACLGIAIGMVAALFLTRALSGFLYGVSATDGQTFLSVSILLAGVALMACLLPARRAAKTDPITALRYE
jgi:predicted permease